MGKGQKKYVSKMDAAATRAAAKEAKKKDRLAAKLHSVEEWGGKLGYTEDNHHYHDPHMAKGKYCNRLLYNHHYHNPHMAQGEGLITTHTTHTHTYTCTTDILHAAIVPHTSFFTLLHAHFTLLLLMPLLI